MVLVLPFRGLCLLVFVAGGGCGDAVLWLRGMGPCGRPRPGSLSPASPPSRSRLVSALPVRGGGTGGGTAAAWLSGRGSSWLVD